MTTFTYLLDLEKSIDPGMENKIKKYELKKKKMQAKILIDPEIFKKGLKDFGTTYDNYNHAYLGLNISGKELISVGGITNYKYLQKVDVSNNDLATLEQLSGLNHLTELNASHNKIEEIMDFDPPQNLEKVNYSFNLIQVIQNIEKNPFLKILILSNNNISKIDGLSTCEFLEELDLSNNHIENIENLDPLSSCLTKLNLSSNRIKKITGLDNLTSLMELNLCQNEISRLKGLQGLENLRYLYLSSNKLSRCNQVAYLADLPFLTDLDFCFNDVQHKKFYRYQILYYIPQLRILDGQDVTHYEKVKADILFGADLDNKKEIFNAYLQEEEFVDRRLFVAEQIDPESDSEGERLEDGEIIKGKSRGTNYSKNNATMSSIDRNGTLNQKMDTNDDMMASNQIKIDPFTY
jgi:Leucine-rich repeat (LRR) protein